ncbi:hypothetical protein KW785_00245 [Candidatus Parcubacteria bacterium]|nr:hypothetical protein [Candidatus Parcubacteria bacterium]
MEKPDERNAFIRLIGGQVLEFVLTLNPAYFRELIPKVPCNFFIGWISVESEADHEGVVFFISKNGFEDEGSKGACSLGHPQPLRLRKSEGEVRALLEVILTAALCILSWDFKLDEGSHLPSGWGLAAL